MSDIYLSIAETPAVVTLSQPVISGALSSTVTVANTVTVALDANSLSALENVTVTVGAAVSVSNFPSTQTIAGTVTANTAYAVSVTGIAGFAAGTVTAIPVALVDRGVYGGNLLGYNGTNTYLNTAIESVGGNSLRAGGTFPVSGSVTIGSLPAISGTVTANVYVAGYDQYYEEKTELPVISFNQPINTAASDKTIPVQIANDSGTLNSTNPLPISGTVTIGNSVTIGSLPAISGTVTANNPNGALTTRFGSVATANLAFITSAVTNTSRKYLLAQNISAGTVTIGIGFSPTTTQGIQLAAGGGLTFDAFCPTGAVYWLGAVTGAAFTILEG